MVGSLGSRATASIGVVSSSIWLLNTKKSRKKTAQRNNDKREADSKKKIKQDSLAKYVPAVFVPPGSQILGHLWDFAEGSAGALQEPACVMLFTWPLPLPWSA